MYLCIHNVAKWFTIVLYMVFLLASSSQPNYKHTRNSCAVVCLHLLLANTHKTYQHIYIKLSQKWTHCTHIHTPTWLHIGFILISKQANMRTMFLLSFVCVCNTIRSGWMIYYTLETGSIYSVYVCMRNSKSKMHQAKSNSIFCSV